LRQLLMNLVINGIEAAGTDGWVRVELSADSAATTIRVLDSGSGLDPSLAERLFEPFATAKPEGIGLGLTVAKKIVESHGGTIGYARVGPTCFEVVLPVEALGPSTTLAPLPLEPCAAGAAAAQNTETSP